MAVDDPNDKEFDWFALVVGMMFLGVLILLALIFITAGQ